MRGGTMEKTHAGSFGLEQLEARFMLAVAAYTKIFEDFFRGDALNSSIWHMPHWTPDGSTFLGRTQLRVDQNASPPVVGNNRVQLWLDTFNPTGLSFYGSEIISNSSYSVGTGLVLKIRARTLAPVPGAVAGLFLYGLNGTDAGGNPIRNEVDSELVTAQPRQVNTNVYSNEGFTSAGSAQTPFLPRQRRISEYHTYEVAVFPDRIYWSVDGRIVRKEYGTIPSGQMAVTINFWAPDSNWKGAYNGNIQPTSDSSQNQRFTMDVDYVGLFSAKPITTTTKPTVSITSAPKLGDFGTVSGTVTGVKFNHFRIATYINVDGTSGAWWTKPSFAQPLTYISTDGSWSGNMLNAGVDNDAVEIRAYLVPETFVPPAASGSQTLPSSLSPFIYASLKR